MPAKFNILVALTVPLVPVIPLLACGGSDAKPDAHVVVHDGSGGSGSGSGSGSNSLCSVSANYGALTTFTSQAAKYTAGSAADMTNTLSWQGQLPGSQTAAVEVLIFSNCGSGSGSQCGGYPTPDWPTTFAPKSGLDLATAPDAIVAVLGNPNTSTMRFQDFYLSTAGTLNITAAQTGAGHTFSGSLSNLATTHYDLAGSGGPAADGCMSAITSLSFSGSAMFNGKVIILDGVNRDEALKNYLAHRWQ